MEIPSLREIQLESLIREQDRQIATLSNELTYVRSHAITQSGPSSTEAPSLSPAWFAYLQSHVAKASQTACEISENPTSTVTKALSQKTKSLQDENDELYRLLHISDAEKVREELFALRKAVFRMERALSECHDIISSLSTELEESNRALLVSYHKPDKLVTTFHSQSCSPRLSPGSLDNNEVHTSRPIPTGPRGEKRPRLSESHSPQTTLSSQDLKRSARRDSSPRLSKEPQFPSQRDSYMEIDDKKKRRLASSPPRQGRNYNRQRPTERNRDRDRGRSHNERDQRRERDRDPYPKNIVKGVGANSKGGRRMRISGNGDRTLAERMGL